MTRMGIKDDRKHRRSRRKSSADGVCAGEDASLREKQRARDLRHTSWWRKKIAAGRCHYCGGSFRPDELTMDHLIPLSRGGTSERQNIVAACKECNNKKKYLLPAEWDEYLNSISNR